ncbi:MAG TPA: hypothetical protein DIC19_03225 [Erysipelotrichaceae bacterium]|nr:hypothetical protein [Erysipelotrichaceae bacterium]
MSNKYLGCLLGAAIGDAMGAATEMRTRKQIEAKFGYVRDFLTPPEDTFARGCEAGSVTDDFSLAFTTIETILSESVINLDTAKKALIHWGDPSNFYSRFAGPTTQIAIRKLKGEIIPDMHGFKLCNDNSKASNGAAMKMSPIALFSHGDVDKAIRIAYTVSTVSHHNNISISAACAIAAATAKAMQADVTLSSIMDAGIYGAIEGERLGSETGATLAGPSVKRRIEWAIDLGKQAKPLIEIMDDISDLVGTGLAAAEAVPAVFGLIQASFDRPMEAIYAAVNIGNDTDTIATMVGGILGAYYGSKAFSSEHLKLLNRVNNFDLDVIANKIEAFR